MDNKGNPNKRTAKCGRLVDRGEVINYIKEEFVQEIGRGNHIEILDPDRHKWCHRTPYFYGAKIDLRSIHAVTFGQEGKSNQERTGDVICSWCTALRVPHNKSCAASVNVRPPIQ
eukprot:GHVU01164910.1.p2 GENE.GHVU01164910.1~~GHVU01164910.1.p2  ORF type:complete len:115 (+),score=4.46 GHVU01164910.1:502-846(+)